MNCIENNSIEAVNNELKHLASAEVLADLSING